MEKYIFDRNNSLWYELQGDYYIPCLALDATDTQSIGIVDQKASAVHQGASHGSLYRCADQWKTKQLSCRSRQPGKETLDLLVNQIAEKKGVTEQLKSQNQMAWGRRMNNIRTAAEEIDKVEVIFV